MFRGAQERGTVFLSRSTFAGSVFDSDEWIGLLHLNVTEAEFGGRKILPKITIKHILLG